MNLDDQIKQLTDLIAKLVPTIDRFVDTQKTTNLEISKMRTSNIRLANAIEKLANNAEHEEFITKTKNESVAKPINQTNQKIRPIYKYKLKEIIETELPKSMKMSSIEKILANEYGISQNEFYRDRVTLYESNYSILGDRLIVYSKLFDRSIEELMNRSVKVKPLVNNLDSTIKSPLR